MRAGIFQRHRERRLWRDAQALRGQNGDELAGFVWAYGCKHLASAEALFDRREVGVSPGRYSALLC